MTENNMISSRTIEDIPDKFLIQILENLELPDQLEAGMVNAKWFNCMYGNPRNRAVLSLLFGNVYLDDLEPPLSYFIESKIPYKRLVLGSNVFLGSLDKFCAKIGETIEELVIKQTFLKPKFDRKALTAGRIADILGHMKTLKSLELNWNMLSDFLNGNSIFQRQNGEKAQKALESVTEFRLIGRDVTAEQFLDLVLPMKHLESLFVKITYTGFFCQENRNKLTDWNTILIVVKEHASTLCHLFIDLRMASNEQDLPVNKFEFLDNLRRLQLKSLSINLAYDLYPNSLAQLFTRFTQTLTTLGPVPKNDTFVQPMMITPSNLNILVKVLPNLQYINVEVSRGFLKDMTIFQRLPDMRSLNLNVNRFDRNHHLFHRETQELSFKIPTTYPKLHQLKIMGSESQAFNRIACIKCVLYMTVLYPNITRLELNVNFNEGVDDQMMRLIFHHLTKLEILGINSCKGVTDEAFAGIIPTYQHDNEAIRGNFAISNLKNLHTLILYPLIRISDVAFVEGISKLPKLRRLAMNGLNYTTAKGIEALVDGCPKLEVIYFEDCANFDEHFVKFIISRLIYLKFLRLGSSPDFPEELTCIEGLELSSEKFESHRTAVWKAHNAYKISKSKMPLNVLDIACI